MYEKVKNEAIVDASKPDSSDIWKNPSTYFSCGFSRVAYYNNRYATAIAIIGCIYGEKTGKRRDYCKGIFYLAEQCKISRAQIKSLRKNFKSLGGYRCKVPYNVCIIIEKIIELLEDNRDNELVKMFLASQSHTFYRNVLIEVHDVAISAIAKHTKKQKIKDVRKNLDKIVKTI